MIDGGVFIDKDPTNGLGETAENIIKRMDQLGIQRALATSFKGIYFDDKEGNLLTEKVCAQSKGRLLPLATINMLGYDIGENIVSQIASGPFYGISLFPDLQGWQWSDYAVEALVRNCTDVQLPIQACVWDRKNLAEVGRYLAPTGAKILLRWMAGSGYRLLPEIMAIGQDFPNVIFDISTITQTGGIKLLVERLGAERFYLASGMPLIAEAAPYFLLEAAELSEDDHAMVRSGTLAKTLGLKEIDQEHPNIDSWNRMRAMPKVDTHWHTSGWNIIEPCTSLESIKHTFNSYNYNIAITSSIRALNHDIVAGNAETKDFTRIEPRARGMVVINPLDVKTSIAEFEKYKDDPAFVGIKTIQDFYKRDLDDPDYMEIFSNLQNTPEWTIMAHLPGMDRAAIQLPHLQFVAAHSTWRHRHFANIKNVWFDIATSSANRLDANLEDLLAAVGEDRILFSSDGQLITPAWPLGKLASANIPDTVLEKIFQVNAFAAFPRLALLQAGTR